MVIEIYPPKWDGNAIKDAVIKKAKTYIKPQLERIIRKRIAQNKNKDESAVTQDEIDEYKLRSVYRVSIIYHQSKKRWLLEDPTIPRRDIGLDLDNIAKPILDGLGEIIGTKYQWKYDPQKRRYVKTGKSQETSDVLIVELHVKKVNSGEDKEWITIEVEYLYTSL